MTQLAATLGRPKRGNLPRHHGIISTLRDDLGTPAVPRARVASERKLF